MPPRRGQITQLFPGGNLFQNVGDVGASCGWGRVTVIVVIEIPGIPLHPSWIHPIINNVEVVLRHANSQVWGDL